MTAGNEPINFYVLAPGTTLTFGTAQGFPVQVRILSPVIDPRRDNAMSVSVLSAPRPFHPDHENTQMLCSPPGGPMLYSYQGGQFYPLQVGSTVYLVDYFDASTQPLRFEVTSIVVTRPW